MEKLKSGKFKHKIPNLLSTSLLKPAQKLKVNLNLSSSLLSTVNSPIPKSPLKILTPRIHPIGYKQLNTSKTFHTLKTLRSPLINSPTLITEMLKFPAKPIDVILSNPNLPK